MENWYEMTQTELLEHINDKNPTIRWKIVNRIDPIYLPRMMDDKDWLARLEVIKRIDPSYLPRMMDDEYVDIRRTVAQRIDPIHLPKMINDEEIREIIFMRIPRELVPAKHLTKFDEFHVKLVIAA